ncbi:MAG: hypothetical protein WC291_11115 [Thermodesulfovibrionales bacterium]|jgi:hypothetical protein
MSGIIGILIIIAIAAYCSERIVRRRKEREECMGRLSLPVSVQIQRDEQSGLREVRRAVEAELAVINRTKDAETAIRGFAAIRSHLARLSGFTRTEILASITIGEKEICSDLELNDLSGSLAELEKEWMRGFFTEKTDTLLAQAEATTDAVLKVELAREALRSALKGLEYLPDDEALKTQADLAEQRLADLSGAQ